MVFGVATGFPLASWTTTERNNYYAAVKAAGFTKVRFDYSGLSGSSSDIHVTSAINAGLSVLLIIGSASGTSASTYATLCTSVANFYGSRVSEYELINEINLNSWTGATYAPVGKAGSDAILAVQPGATIHLGSIAVFGTINSDPKSMGTFLQSIYDACTAQGLGHSWFHTVNVHPYEYTSNQTFAAMQTSAATFGWGQMFDTTPSVRSVMNGAGDSAKRIVITEFGAPTLTDASMASNDFPSGVAIQESVQSQMFGYYLADWASRAAATPSLIGDCLIFSFRDLAPESQTGTNQGHFGIVRNDYTQKAAYSTVVAQLAASSGGSGGGTSGGSGGVTVHELAAGSVAGDGNTLHTFTLTAGATAGSLVVFALGFKTLATSAAVTDSRGNTWSMDVPVENFQSKSALIASTMQNVAALQAGDTVTVTLTGGVFTSPIQTAWWIEEFTGMTSTPLDQTQKTDVAAGLTGSTGATAATAQANEVAVAVISVGSTQTSLTPASYTPFTTGAQLNNTRAAMAVYKVLTSTGPASESFTWASTADSAVAMIATYKATAQASGPFNPAVQGGSYF